MESLNTETNLRQAARKILRCRALIRTEDGEIAQGKTMDISLDGVCIVLERLIPDEQMCELRFEIVANGQLHLFQAKARLIYCICTNFSYRAGFRFFELDPKQIEVIKKLGT